MNIVVYKTAVALLVIGALALGLFLLREQARARRFVGWFNVPVGWALTRLLPWIVVYFLAGFAPQSDVATAFWPQARGAAEGGIPYRDFESFFGPLFPYLLALPVLIWKDPHVLILFLSLLEAVAVHMTLRAAGFAAGSVQRARWLVLYFVAPGPLLLAVIGGQEDFLLWLGGLILWLLLAQQKDFALGALAVIFATLSKPLFVIPAAAFAALSRRPLKFIAGALPLALAVLLLLWAVTGTAFLYILSASENLSPPNIWIWLHWLSGGFVPITNPRLSLVMLGLVVVFAAGYFGLNRTKIAAHWQPFFAAWTVLFAVSMLLNLKSLGAYFGFFALPSLTLFLRINHRPAIVAWLLLGAIAPIESSLWYHSGQPLLTGLPPNAMVSVEYLLQGVMLACLAGLALAAHRFLRSFPSPAPAFRP